MRSAAPGLSLFLLLLALWPAHGADPALAGKAHAILKAHCFRCHGPDGQPKGGFGYVLEREQLIARNKVVPGKPAQSELYQRIVKGEMPPKDRPRVSNAELALLRDWIDAGAPPFAPASGPRTPVYERDVLRLIAADLQTINERQRRFVRYLTLTHMHNAGRSEQELHLLRQAVAKLINSLSYHPRVTVPRAVDTAQTILRIDLRDYKWGARNWDRLVAVYPYRIPGSSAEAKALAAATGTELPFLRADWFVATAVRPPLYHDLLQLPSSNRELERLLHVDVPGDIQDESAVRTGFNDSGVSKNNRLLERHDAAHGAYWRSYDFAENTGRQNLFEHPLGPAAGENSFQPAGGEIIFHLPNGLFGFMLVDGNGRRVDRAPSAIVSDPRRPDRIVENGLSCMSCHGRGLIPKGDQVRAHVEKNPAAFNRADVETVKALYAGEAKVKRLVEEDNQRYLKALAATGAHTAEDDPITLTTLRYEATLDLTAAAAEAGLPNDEFLKRLGRSQTLARVLGPLNGKGGTVTRDAFVAAFPDVVREFRLGDDPGAIASADTVPALRPFAGHTGAILCVAFVPDGRLALTGSADRTLRLWDIATGREVRRFTGHTDDVLAVAFSPDGRLAISGGADRSVRIWEVSSGRELQRLTGHSDKVRAAAFSPDGRRVLSGSQDHTLRLWNAEESKEIRTFTGHGHWVSSIAFSPDGRRILSGGHDRTVRLWDAESGRELGKLEGHTREVYSVAFSPDGRRALSGGEDRTVRLWDIETSKELRRLEGHNNAVIAVRVSADGRQLLSGSSQYRRPDKTLRLWDADTGRALRSVGGAENERVGCVAFSADGRYALTGNPEEKCLRLWKLSD
jgi:mono/diheme cytochrome c family protein